MAMNLDCKPEPRKPHRFGACRSNPARFNATARSHQNDARAAMSVIKRSGTRIRILLRAALAWFAAAIRRRHTRRELARLDDRMLRDIGLTRHDLGRSQRGPF
jgi:uncharacterized protein YjiS (DUF1127 family)